jgi:hypothetical protein
MTPGDTSILAVKKALVALFTEAVSPPTEVHYNRPNTKHQMEENVYVTNILHGRREYKTLGPIARARQIEETYSISVEVEVQRRGSDAEAAELRAIEIGKALEQQFVLDPTLGGLVQEAIAGDFDLPSQGGADGWSSPYTFAVQISARI